MYKVAVDLGYIAAITPEFDALIDEIGRMLTAMLKKFGNIHCTPTPSTYH